MLYPCVSENWLPRPKEMLADRPPPSFGGRGLRRQSRELDDQAGYWLRLLVVDPVLTRDAHELAGA